MDHPTELSPERLSYHCSPDELNFETTDELPSLEEVLGQPRALSALQIGSEVTGPGFNIFVSGLPDSGRTTLTQEYIQRKAEGGQIPVDWCYVNNFDNPYQPTAISLKPGQAAVLKEDMEELITRCQQEIRQVFRSEEYLNQRSNLTKSIKETQDNEFQKLQETANNEEFSIVRTPAGFGLVPMKNDKPYTPEEFNKLPENQQQKLLEIQGKLEQTALETFLKIREMDDHYYQKIRELDNYTALIAVNHLFEASKKKYSKHEKVSQHLSAVQSDIIENADKFREDDEKPADNRWLNRYQVNILVDNSKLDGSPVVMESYPTYQNLVGRIEHRLVMGAAQTDFTMIRPGALHRANGGYLLLPARELLLSPYAWQGLERALRDGKVRILNLGIQKQLLNTSSLEPEPIPFSGKVILFGTPILYELLRLHDADFAKLFKVRADFATIMDRDDKNVSDYALFVKSVVDSNDLLPFDKNAVARIVEYSIRMAGDQEKLSTRFGQISDLTREASYWAQKEDSQIVTKDAVDKAILERDYRSSLPEELIQEKIHQESILIDVTGKAIGQVNALSVSAWGDYVFGRPSRVTASVYPGSEGIVDIEKQAELGGPIHTKGVLILSGIMGRRYGHNQPLNLTANLTFEQSYGGVEGDSASAAEMCALLSAIANIPLRQDRAMTGSINQLGEIQVVGSINEKIEGFFNTCEGKGLTGSQGVIIPEGNQRNLMLNAEVIEAVRNNKFHIWPIRSLEEGLSLLTDIKIGEIQDDGTYPKGTFNYAVSARLDEFKELMKTEKKPAEK